MRVVELVAVFIVTGVSTILGGALGFLMGRNSRK